MTEQSPERTPTQALFARCMCSTVGSELGKGRTALLQPANHAAAAPPTPPALSRLPTPPGSPRTMLVRTSSGNQSVGGWQGRRGRRAAVCSAGGGGPFCHR